jgi:hypothetical protein
MDARPAAEVQTENAAIHDLEIRMAVADRFVVEGQVVGRGPAGQKKRLFEGAALRRRHGAGAPDRRFKRAGAAVPHE